MPCLTERLLELDSGAVSDALDSLGLPAAVAGIAPLSVRVRIAGPAATVLLGTDPPAAGSKQHLCTRAIEAAHAGDVIVVQQTTGIPCAGWGGVLSAGAKQKGLAGVIVEGPARDIDDALALEFPVYARHATALTARGRVHERAFNCPISVGSVRLYPGDYVLADSSGVAVIPQGRAEEVVAVAERIAHKERLMVAAARRGVPMPAVMGENYETLLETKGDS
jgi:regulator of RNase E activity RraA